jgi:F-type H+-transporting ATPase subunit epsilon
MLRLKIISPVETIFDGEIKHAIFPGEVGMFEVLPKHAPLISSLVKGEISYVLTSGEEKKIQALSGFVEVNADIITVCMEN